MKLHFLNVSARIWMRLWSCFSSWSVRRGRALKNDEARQMSNNEHLRAGQEIPVSVTGQSDEVAWAQMIATVAQMMAGVTIRDREGRIVYVNPAYESMTGFTCKELVGRTGVDATRSDAMAREMCASITTGIAWRKVYQDTHKNGSVIYVDTMASPIFDHQAIPRYVLSIYQDVTNDIHVRHEMKRLVQIVEHSADGIQILNDAYRVEYCNPAFYRITGTHSALVIGKHAAQYPGSLLSPQQFADAMTVVKSNTCWQQEISGSRENGMLVAVKILISSIAEAQQIRYYVVTIRDVLHEKELEKQVQEAQKMESVGRLAGGIAHDFNNMLQGILGFAELIEMDVRNKDLVTHENILEIQRAAGRARDLTKQLLAFGSRQLIQMMAVNLNTQIRSMRKMLACMAGDGISFRFQLESALHLVWADPTQIEQVIMNVVINARDAMTVQKGSAMIGIVTHNVRRTIEDCPAHCLTASCDYVCLSISDSGGGIREEHLPLIFEPFFTTKEVGKGTGLGLSVVYGIVKQHNGWIEVDSVVNVGTTFMIYFPAYQNSSDVQHVFVHEDVEQKRCGSGMTVLVVDDEEVVRHLNARALQAAGYRVLSAASEEEGYACFVEHQSEIQLLFADVLLNGGNGIDLADRVRRVQPHLPVLLCSGAAQSLLRERAIQHNYAFIEKPYSAEHLLSAIDRLLHNHRKSFVHPVVTA